MSRKLCLIALALPLLVVGMAFGDTLPISGWNPVPTPGPDIYGSYLAYTYTSGASGSLKIVGAGSGGSASSVAFSGLSGGFTSLSISNFSLCVSTNSGEFNSSGTGCGGGASAFSLSYSSNNGTGTLTGTVVNFGQNGGIYEFIVGSLGNGVLLSGLGNPNKIDIALAGPNPLGSGTSRLYNFDIKDQKAVPEPASALLLAIGGMGLFSGRFRKRCK